MTRFRFRGAHSRCLRHTLRARGKTAVHLHVPRRSGGHHLRDLDDHVERLHGGGPGPGHDVHSHLGRQQREPLVGGIFVRVRDVGDSPVAVVVVIVVVAVVPSSTRKVRDRPKHPGERDPDRLNLTLISASSAQPPNPV